MNKVLALIFFFYTNSYSQKKDSIRYKNHGFIFTNGFSVGNETVIGIPKFDIYKEFGNHKIKPYIGVGSSIYFFFAAWGSISVQAGLSYKNLTFDTSLARWKYKPSPAENGVKLNKFGPFSHSSWNPKIGFRKLNQKNNDFWLKIGPSFIFNQNNGNSIGQFTLVDLIEIKSQNFNVEGTFVIRF